MKLPKLPEPFGHGRKQQKNGGYLVYPSFNAEQMQEYARQTAAEVREICLAEIEQGIWFDMSTEQILDSIAAAIRSRT